MKKIIGIAGLVLAAVAAGSIYMGSTGSSSLPGLTAQAQSGDATAGEIDTSLVVPMVIGNPDATVKVVEYASFTCPHCADFHENVYADLKANYIDTGKISFELREVYFDRFGLWAGMVARCGGEMRYYGIVDRIFDTQKEWIGNGEPASIAENLKRIGKASGLGDDELKVCLDNGEMAQAMVANYQEMAEADDVSGTPTFLINGKKFSNMSFKEFSAVLDEQLAE